MTPLLAAGFGAAALVLVSAVWVVTLPNLFRAALSLGLALVGIAGLFLLLEAEFLAFVQILVYVGAILTLVVFAIMVTAKLEPPEAVAASRQSLPAAAASLGLFVVLVTATRPLLQAHVASAEPVSLAAVGQQLVTTLVLPFEVISLVFVSVVVGAIVIATPRGPRSSG